MEQRHVKTGSPGSRSAAAVLAIGCLVVLVWALFRANAAWHFVHAKAGAEPMFASGIVVQPTLQEVESSLASARRYFPANPDYLQFAGRLAVLQASQPGVVGSERQALLEQAAGNIRLALQVRPLWPYSWAGLLSIKGAAGQVDGEFKKALRQSAILGPWEKSVQRRIIHSGLRHWDRLALDERNLVRSAVTNALRVQPRMVFETVREYGRPDLLCNEEVRYAAVRKWCSAVGMGDGE